MAGPPPPQAFQPVTYIPQRLRVRAQADERAESRPRGADRACAWPAQLQKALESP